MCSTWGGIASRAVAGSCSRTRTSRSFTWAEQRGWTARRPPSKTKRPGTKVPGRSYAARRSRAAWRLWSLLRWGDLDLVRGLGSAPTELVDVFPFIRPLVPLGGWMKGVFAPGGPLVAPTLARLVGAARRPRGNRRQV